MNPRLAVWIVNGLLAGLAAASLFPLLWMLSVSFMPAGASTTLPAPLLPPAVTLDNYRQLFGSVGMGRYLFNSLAIATLATLISVSFNVMAATPSPSLRFRGRDAIFKAMLAALVIPARCDAAALPDAEAARAHQHIRRCDRAGDGQHLRHLPRASVRAGIPTTCSRPRASTAPANSASS